MDTYTQERISKLHPIIRNDVKKIFVGCLYKKINIRIVQGLRTTDEQNALFAQGRTHVQMAEAGLGSVQAKPDLARVTNAIGGTSWHNYGLAFDFCLLHENKTISWSRTEDIDQDHEPDWMEVVDLALSAGFFWGGNFNSFPDFPHLQKTFNLTIKKAKALLDSGRIDSNGYLIL